MAITAAAMTGLIILVSTLFLGLSNQYRESTATESASHLFEITEQIRLYVEEKIKTDWRVAWSVANSIDARYRALDIDELYLLMKEQRDVWGVSDILVYTESGFCTNAGGEVFDNEDASDAVYFARKNGRYMDIIRSTVTYTVAIESDRTVNGSPIAAVGVVQQLDSFIDNMGFSFFDGEAHMYLARSGGELVSKLTHPDALEIYNVLSLFDGLEVACLAEGGEAIEETFNTLNAFTYTCRGGKEDCYVAVTPVEAGEELWQLLYFVPESVLNATAVSFSRRITVMSFVIILLFALIGITVLALAFRARRQAFDSVLAARDRMFDQLVSTTRYAFALLSMGSEEPLYVSSNVRDIIGEGTLRLKRENGVFSIPGSIGQLSEGAAHINESLAKWDGQGEYVSDFIPFNYGGEKRYYVIRINRARGEADEYVTIAQDVTAEREREHELREALALADSANIAKTRFLANMSHDIRTPMNAIMNVTRFALESMDDKEQLTEHLYTILDSSDHLLTLINDILDMSRIESGQAVISNEPFDIMKCLSEAADMIQPLAAARAETFTADFSRVRTRRLTGDRLKLSQVLINLLNNAVKFTHDGGRITFTAEELPSIKANMATVRFTVSDNGRGIEPELHQAIFEPFTRAADDGISLIEGTGLGLSICKSYVTAMGGTISVESAPGKGSAFAVELFFGKDDSEVPRQAAAPKEEISFGGMRALLCEDNAVNMKIAQRILGRLGFEVETALDGNEAVRAFAASPSGYYDVVYMDIQMPVMNGYEAAAGIRRLGRGDSRTVPIIAMTANVFAADVEKARSAGMNGHIGKPIVVRELAVTTAKAIASAGNGGKEK